MRTYRSGDVIDTVVNLTANHLGWIEFRLCPHDKYDQTVTQECLDKNVLRIMRSSISKKNTKRLYVGKSHLISMKLKLPHNLSCRKCVLQWKYNAGNLFCMFKKLYWFHCPIYYIKILLQISILNWPLQPRNHKVIICKELCIEFKSVSLFVKNSTALFRLNKIWFYLHDNVLITLFDI